MVVEVDGISGTGPADRKTPKEIASQVEYLLDHRTGASPSSWLSSETVLKNLFCAITPNIFIGAESLSSLVVKFTRAEKYLDRRRNTVTDLMVSLGIANDIADAEMSSRVRSDLDAILSDSVSSEDFYNGVHRYRAGMASYSNNRPVHWSGEPFDQDLFSRFIKLGITMPMLTESRHRFGIQTPGQAIQVRLIPSELFHLCETQSEASLAIALIEHIREHSMIFMLNYDDTRSWVSTEKPEAVFLREVRRFASSGLPLDWYIGTSKKIVPGDPR